MLHQMAEDYEVDQAYVLDMYRRGKVSWMLDFAIRAGVGILLLVVGSVIVRGVKKAVRRKSEGYISQIRIQRGITGEHR